MHLVIWFAAINLSAIIKPGKVASSSEDRLNSRIITWLLNLLPQTLEGNESAVTPFLLNATKTAGLHMFLFKVKFDLN